MSSVRAARIPIADARRRILVAARTLLRERSFAALTVRDVMAEAGLTRTNFYRCYPDLPALAADLLPDSDAPLIDHVERLEAERPEAVIPAMIDGLVDLYAEHGPLLRAVQDASRDDAAFAARLDTALTGPRALIGRLLGGAAHPPADVEESVHLLMVLHREYLLDRFGGGDDSPGRRMAARTALGALWERLLA